MYENIYQILRKNAFTLAEIMIALVVIGVITSILLPVAFNNIPNENVMKFKKGNATLAKVINELVTSGEYYTPGDLGKKPNGELIVAIKKKGDKINTYHCETIAQIISYKIKNCSASENEEAGSSVCLKKESELANAKQSLDYLCRIAQKSIGAEIITTDNIALFQTKPRVAYGDKWITSCPDGNHRVFGDEISPCCTDDNGFDGMYKIFCMDIDGVDYGEEPFGYGVRVDGKILTGKRADEWMEKSMQDKE